MRWNKAKMKAWIDGKREEELRELESIKAGFRRFVAEVRVPLRFKNRGGIAPAIEGVENGQGWVWLLSYWDVDRNEPWVRVGITQNEVV